MSNRHRVWVVAVFAIVCATAIAAFVIWPRPVAPSRTAEFKLEVDAAAAQLAQDRRDAAHAPGDATATTIMTLVGDFGAAETGDGEASDLFERRRRSLARAVSDLRSHHGDAAVTRLRAKAADDAIGALSGAGDLDRRRRILGTFRDTLRTLADARTGEISSTFVIRTLYKARFNAILGVALTAGFAPVEERTYWGWLALGATRADPAKRLVALRRYEAVAKVELAESRATLLFLAEDYAGAARAFEELHETTGSLSMRNHALAATQMLE